jgi:hypothetical protein
MFQFAKQQPNRIDPLQRYCEKQHCNRLVQYNKITTSGNNPKMSSSMRYSQLVKSGKFTSVPAAQFAQICPNVLTAAPIKCTNPIFDKNYVSQKPKNCSCNSTIAPYFTTSNNV